MTYAIHADIVQSSTMRQRIMACVAQEGQANPTAWVNANIWALPKADWIAAWASAEAGDPGGDHGSNEGAVTDGMILASVQAQISGG
jgi:hypothetical protein